MTTDIECQVCHRISFSWEDSRDCPDCHWPIRPVDLDAPAFGWDVAVQTRTGPCATEVVSKHFSTPSETVARNRAKRTRNYCAVLAVRPLTERQWISGYGDPRDKSRFS